MVDLAVSQSLNDKIFNHGCFELKIGLLQKCLRFYN